MLVLRMLSMMSIAHCADSGSGLCLVGLVPFQLVGTNADQPRSEVLFAIAPSSTRLQVTLSLAGFVNARTFLMVDQTQGPAMGSGMTVPELCFCNRARKPPVLPIQNPPSCSLNKT